MAIWDYMIIWDYMDCGNCPSYSRLDGRAGDDPRRCCPSEELCADGDFGNEHICKRMIRRVEEGLSGREFDNERFVLASLENLTNSYYASGRYAEELGAWPDVDWSAHPYWQIFHSDAAPIGFDTPEEVCEKVFM